MSDRRIQRVNSLLKEVISEVLSRDLDNRDVPNLLTVTAVDATKDFKQAKVYVSIIHEDEKVKAAMIEKLQVLAGYIGVLASKKVVLRYFPSLTFVLDVSIENYMQIDDLLRKIDNDKAHE